MRSLNQTNEDEMSAIDVYNVNKEKIGTIEISEDVLKAPVKKQLIHEVVLYQLAKKRAGTHATKNVAKVSGSNKKPWKQKGTGRARAGSNKSPLWNGGGIAFGPQPRDYGYKMNKKKVKGAIVASVRAKINDGAFVLVDNLSFDNGKTKEALMFLNKFELNRKILLIYSKQDEKLIRAFRNLQEVKIIPSCAINVYDLINAKHIIVERNIFEDLIKEANLA